MADMGFLPVFPLLASLLVASPERPLTPPRIEAAAFAQERGRVATNGTSFFAIWTNWAFADTDILGARIDRDGQVLDQTPLVVHGGPSIDRATAIIHADGHYLAVWSGYDHAGGRFIEDDGSMSEPFAIDGVRGDFDVRVAWNGRRYLVVGSNFGAALLEPDGSVVQTMTLLTGERWPEFDVIARGETFYLIACETDWNGSPVANGYPASVFALPVSNDGAIGGRITLASATTPVFDVRAARNGNDVVVAWSTTRGVPGGEIRSVHLDAAGRVETKSIDGNPLMELIARNGEFVFIHDPALGRVIDAATNGERTLLVLQRIDDLYVSTLEEREPRALALAPRHQSDPAVAGGIAVWLEYLPARARDSVMYARVGVDEEGRELDPAGRMPDQPRIAWNGEVALVVWYDAGELRGLRIGVDDKPFSLAMDTLGAGYDVAWDGSHWVVAHATGPHPRFSTVILMRFNDPSSVERIIDSYGETSYLPVIAASPEAMLVTYLRNGAVHSRLHTAAGVTDVWHGEGSNNRPAVAWNGESFLVAFAGRDLQWQLVSPTGVLRKPAVVFPSIPTDERYPQQLQRVGVVADADRFTIFYAGFFGPLYAITVDRNGVPIDGPRVIAETSAGFDATPTQLFTAHRIGHPSRDIARIFVSTLGRVAAPARRRAAGR